MSSSWSFGRVVFGKIKLAGTNSFSEGQAAFQLVDKQTTVRLELASAVRSERLASTMAISALDEITLDETVCLLSLIRAAFLRNSTVNPYNATISVLFHR
jgi:hypothetical protein